MAEAIALGKQKTWADAPVTGEGGADGHMRIGTNREILSWPGTYKWVSTEADEAEAQETLLERRLDLRASVKRNQKAKQARDLSEKRRQQVEWAKRMEAEKQRQKDEKDLDRRCRQEMAARTDQISGFYEAARSRRSFYPSPTKAVESPQ